MNNPPDIQHPMRDEAFESAIDLAQHILRTPMPTMHWPLRFPGRDRMRFAVLLVMLEEAGKLYNMVRNARRPRSRII